MTLNPVLWSDRPFARIRLRRLVEAIEQADRMNGAKTGRGVPAPVAGQMPHPVLGLAGGAARARTTPPWATTSIRPSPAADACAADPAPGGHHPGVEVGAALASGGANWSSPAKRAVSPGPAGLDLLQGAARPFADVVFAQAGLDPVGPGELQNLGR